MPQMQDDKELIRLVLNGDLGAFGILVKQYENLVLYMVSRFIANDDDVKDVSQEVFVKVYTHLKTFRGEAKFSTWLAQIAYGISINYLKKNKKYETRKAALADNDVVNEHVGSSLEKKEIASFINKEINKLPLNYRTVVTLYHLNEFSYTEIVEITGMPEGTIKGYLFRARAILRDKLKPIKT